MTDETRFLLRSLPSLAGAAPPFDLEVVPGDPVALFLEWLEVAVRAGVAEPPAMTLATVDQGGTPDARILVLKDVDERGWAFASTKLECEGCPAPGQSAGRTHVLLAAARAVGSSSRVRG